VLKVALVLQVVFQLHPTFPVPTREVTQHPFEVQEAGWGEFDIQISVRPMTYIHICPVYVLYFCMSCCRVLGFLSLHVLVPASVRLSADGILTCGQGFWLCGLFTLSCGMADCVHISTFWFMNDNLQRSALIL
jgi:hypothetical protein